jgi:hypothetical protein
MIYDNSYLCDLTTPDKRWENINIMPAGILTLLSFIVVAA